MNGRGSRSEMDVKARGRDFDAGASRLISQAEKVVALWERMDTVVQAEWSVVLKNDTSTLLRLSRMKRDLSDRILREEKELGRLFGDRFGPDPAGSCSGVSSLVRQGLDGEDARRFLSLLRRRDHFRRLVHVTNHRTASWVRDRLGFCNTLCSILSGAGREKAATYGPGGRRRDGDSVAATAVTGYEEGGLDERTLERGLSTYASQAKVRS